MGKLRNKLVVVVGVIALLAAPAIAGAVSGFQGILFGLDTAPNGDILVADAFVGIESIRKGALGPTIERPGATDVSAIGRKSLWVTTGAGGDPTQNTGQGLWRVSDDEATLMADLFAYEAANDPDGPLNPPDGNVDSNPFDVQSLGGRAALVADAGGNDLLSVDNQGNVELLAVFPNELVSTDPLKDLVGCPEPPEGFEFVCGFPPELPAQAVPTSIAIGPDGSYYVGELKGFPGTPGTSRIWKVSTDASGDVCPNPDCEIAFDGGFTAIIDLAFGPDGNLYVAEIDELGFLVAEPGVPFAPAGGTINSCNLDTMSCTEVATEIPLLTAITFGKDGTLWATRNSLIPGSAEVFEVN